MLQVLSNFSVELSGSFWEKKKKVKVFVLIFTSLSFFLNICRKVPNEYRSPPLCLQQNNMLLSEFEDKEGLIRNIITKVDSGSTNCRGQSLIHLFWGTLPSWNSVLWKRTFYDTVVKCALCFTGRVAWIACDKSLGLRRRTNDLKLPLCHAGLICLSRYGLIRTCLTLTCLFSRMSVYCRRDTT